MDAGIDRRRPALFDLRQNGELAVSQASRYVVQEGDVDPALVHVEDEAREAAE